jgi:hypothetical protein
MDMDVRDTRRLQFPAKECGFAETSLIPEIA